MPSIGRYQYRNKRIGAWPRYNADTDAVQPVGFRVAWINETRNSNSCLCINHRIGGHGYRAVNACIFL